MYSQSANNWWYFGDGAGVHFTQGFPQADTSSDMFTNEGSSSISDIDGNLLFYTNGEELYNRNHEITPNGGGLADLTTPTQSSIFLQHPGNDSTYYLFVQESPMVNSQGLKFNLINLNLDNGLGDIVDSIKNQQLQINTTEKLTAVRSTSFQGYWLLALSSDTAVLNAYRIDQNGLDTTPVTSSFNSPFTYIPSNNFQGFMKVSPSGEFIAAAFTTAKFLLVGRLNAESGLLSSVLVFEPQIAGNTFTPYGVEFSPDSKQLYVQGWEVDLTQYHLKDFASLSSFINSVDPIVISHTPGVISPILGPDDKIYLANYFDPYLALLNQPNRQGIDCDFVDSAVYLYRNCIWGTPNQTPFVSDIRSEIFCFGDSSLFWISYNNCDSITWDFDDPGSASNTAQGDSVKHLFSDTGFFTVTAILDYGQYIDTLTKTIRIKALPQKVLMADQPLCIADTIPLSVQQSDVNYLWSTGSDSSAILASDSGLYTITISNECDTVIDSSFVHLVDSIQLDLGPDDTLCPGESTFIAATLDNFTEVLWSTGDSINQELIVNHDSIDSTLIWLEASNACNTDRDSVTVHFQPNPNLDFFTDDLLCDLENPFIAPVLQERVDYTLLLQNDFGSFDTLFPWRIDEPGLYRMVAENHCDTLSREHPFSPYNIIEINLPSDTAVCPADLLILDATWPGSSYLWESSALDSVVTDSALAIESEAVYTVTITNPPCTRVEDVSVVFDESLCDSVACKFEVSNVITPNGDGVNDLWRVSNACDLSYEVFVYNRWGQLVYSTSSVGDDEYADQSLTGTRTHPLTSASGRTGTSQEGGIQRSIAWDGRVNGEAVSDGVYFYLISYDGGKRSQKGSITVICE